MLTSKTVNNIVRKFCIKIIEMHKFMQEYQKQCWIPEIRIFKFECEVNENWWFFSFYTYFTKLFTFFSEKFFKGGSLKLAQRMLTG